VRATATGRALATVAVPKPDGTFVQVSEAANDRTFVLGAQRLAKISTVHGEPALATQFYLLRIHPSGKTVTTQLVKLPFQTPGAVVDTDIALSPDGSQLAVSMAALRGVDRGVLRIYQTATGTSKTWYPGDLGTGTYDHSGSSLSWETNGQTLERVLNHPGGSAGEPYEQVQWSSASGNVLLISGARSGTPLPHAAFYMSAVGVLAGSTYTPLPWSSTTFMAAW
jgi:hypothetical protein